MGSLYDDMMAEHAKKMREDMRAGRQIGPFEGYDDLLEACRDTITYLSTRADDDSNVLWGKVTAAYRKALGIND